MACTAPTAPQHHQPDARPEQPDFVVANYGSLFLLDPLTPAAAKWPPRTFPTTRQWWAGGVVVEPPYIAEIVAGIQSDGLKVAQVAR